MMRLAAGGEAGPYAPPTRLGTGLDPHTSHNNNHYGRTSRGDDMVLM
eukprot:CAMPEP_0202812668 /NCGR_PEP_ID=MMETSP1389-20130828/4278_1 /ASSEMBLY_ACC=CAM_ASM_000865 /TAXON_ID=302021 /ORGANISM="Rhodomonas sp., Strain CCMP768" /LENGTH=46 /DNA_ID= /DNA_START= /DNA_END= /DNA_ORIENTATION=